MSIVPIRLVVIDDHTLFRRGLISLLDGMSEFLVVGEAADGKDALALVQASQPDVVLLDVNMPLQGGVATVRQLRKDQSSLKIVMLTISQSDEDLLGAIKAGADGYLLKNTEPSDLRRAILRIMQGQAALSPEVTEPLLKAIVRSSTQVAKPELSEREQEVVSCLAESLTTQQIAKKLFISENTVKTHIRHILEKLDVANRSEAVTRAYQLGIIDK